MTRQQKENFKKVTFDTQIFIQIKFFLVTQITHWIPSGKQDWFSFENLHYGFVQVAFVDYNCKDELVEPLTRHHKELISLVVYLLAQ